MNINDVWRAALGELQLQMTRATFDTWVKNTSVASHEDGTFVIAAHNTYAKEWLENRLHATIKRTLTDIVGHAVEVKFVVRARDVSDGEPVLLLPGQEQPSVRGSSRCSPMLNPRYTFDTFIVGSSNRLAHAAALAVAERPAGEYNPLFIYGDVGLGKTHLLQAIAHVSQSNTLRTLYVSSEKFTNDLINAIRNQTTEAFRETYRTMDVLLIDDIQFIAGKESTQEEFFHTFNTLYAASRQIVISSDRPPRAITTLEDRLRSRFEGGLIADIQPPDFETRMAILRAKAEAQPLLIPPAVIEFIASKVHSNIRELEGALIRVVAYAQMMCSPLTVEVAGSALNDVLLRPDSCSPEEIVETVASYFGLETADLTGRRRSKDIAFARQVAMYLLREETSISLPQIGQVLGGRDHTTVLYGFQKIAAQVEEEDQLRRELLVIRQMLYNGRSQKRG